MNNTKFGQASTSEIQCIVERIVRCIGCFFVLLLIKDIMLRQIIIVHKKFAWKLESKSFYGDFSLQFHLEGSYIVYAVFQCGIVCKMNEMV